MRTLSWSLPLKSIVYLVFFKGALLADTHQLLVAPGENTQSARVIKFNNLNAINTLEATLKAYIFEAVEVENAGLKIAFTKELEPLPEEFQKKLDENADLKVAFDALTPGRKRGYILHFSQPKRSKTREARIEKCVQKILEGKGLND